MSGRRSRGPAPYFSAQGEVCGRLAISCSPTVKMNEKSAGGRPAGTGGRGMVIGGWPGAGGGPAFAARSAGPIRPPERLSQPSTRSWKNGSSRSSRLEVMPPCEWPASQKARMLFTP